MSDDQMAPARTLTAAQSLTSAEKRAYQRARSAMTPYQPTWRLAMAFFDHHQYAEVNAKTAVVSELETAEGGSKPRWLQRPQRNRFTSGCLRECALLASRAPVPECTPRNGDPKAGWAARMAEQALLAAYENLGFEQVVIGRLISAAVQGESYLWPFWDDAVGEFLGEHEDQAVYTGEIGFVKLQADEVLWDAGYSFEQAPVHYVEKAYTVDSVKKRKNYIGPSELEPDAVGSDYEFGMPAGAETKDMVWVIDMLERPCREYPEGRWLSFLRSGELVQSARPYPRDPKRSMNKPCLHQLAWYRRDHRHRHLGAGELAVDIQRTRNRTIAQIGMWKNLVLNPRLLAPYGSLLEEPTGKPGEIIEYRPIGGQAPGFQPVQDIPQSLFTTIELCDRDMEELFGSWDLPDTESAQHMAAAIERDRERRALQAKELARFYCGVMEHMLELMQQHYTEKRLLVMEGRFGVSLVQGFVGTEIPPMMVRITPGSIEARTRASQNALAWQLFETGQVPIHQVMAAINSGSAARLIDGFELQVAKQYREIEQMIGLADESAADLPNPDQLVPELMQTHGIEADQAGQLALELIQGSVLALGPQIGEEDDDEIHADVLSQWMVTRDFELQPEVVQGVARAHLQSHRDRQMLRSQAMAMQTSDAAEQQGAENAARPAGDKPEPSRASMESQKAGMS